MTVGELVELLGESIAAAEAAVLLSSKVLSFLRLVDIFVGMIPPDRLRL